MTFLTVNVASRSDEAEGICSFELVSADGDPLPAFTAGAHIDVHIPGGYVRQYSLCNDPSERGLYRIAVLREDNGRGGSRAMHEVCAGGQLQIGLPRNLFELGANKVRSLLLAGGIGITPIFSMAQTLAASGAPFELHYCTRSAKRAAFLEQIGARLPPDNVHLHHDEGSADQKLDIDVLLGAQGLDCHLYVCGPKGFMDAVLKRARTLGWGEERLHYEFFSAAPIADGESAFDVKLGRSGRLVHVRAEQTVIEALRAADIELPTSCEQGICGTCVTRVLEGIPDHRDAFLMPEEQAANDCFTPCCSRARTLVLVLDL